MEDEFLRDVRQWLLRAEKRGATEHAPDPEDLLIPMPRTPLD